MQTSHIILTTLPARNQSHVLQTIVTCRSNASQVLAAQERHQAAIVYAARMRLAGEAGVSPAGIGTLVAAVRRLTSVALIRSGGRLRGRLADYPATSPTAGA
jgi:hypothetical protein